MKRPVQSEATALAPPYTGTASGAMHAFYRGKWDILVNHFVQ